MQLNHSRHASQGLAVFAVLALTAVAFAGVAVLPSGQALPVIPAMPLEMGLIEVTGSGPSMAKQYGHMVLNGADGYDVEVRLDWLVNLPSGSSTDLQLRVSRMNLQSPNFGDILAANAEPATTDILTTLQTSLTVVGTGTSQEGTLEIRYPNQLAQLQVLRVVQKATHLGVTSSYSSFVVLKPIAADGAVWGYATEGIPSAAAPPVSAMASPCVFGTTTSFSSGPSASTTALSAGPEYSLMAINLCNAKLFAVHGAIPNSVVVPCPPMTMAMEFDFNLRFGVNNPCPADPNAACAGLVIISLGGCQGGEGEPGCSGGLIVALDGACQGGEGYNGTVAGGAGGNAGYGCDGTIIISGSLDETNPSCDGGRGGDGCHEPQPAGSNGCDGGDGGKGCTGTIIVNAHGCNAGDGGDGGNGTAGEGCNHPGCKGQKGGEGGEGGDGEEGCRAEYAVSYGGCTGGDGGDGGGGGCGGQGGDGQGEECVPGKEGGAPGQKGDKSWNPCGDPNLGWTLGYENDQPVCYQVWNVVEERYQEPCAPAECPVNAIPVLVILAVKYVVIPLAVAVIAAAAYCAMEEPDCWAEYCEKNPSDTARCGKNGGDGGRGGNGGLGGRGCNEQGTYINLHGACDGGEGGTGGDGGCGGAGDSGPYGGKPGAPGDGGNGGTPGEDGGSLPRPEGGGN